MAQGGMALARNRWLPAHTLPNRKSRPPYSKLSSCAVDFSATVRLGIVSGFEDTAKRIVEGGGENNDGPRR